MRKIHKALLAGGVSLAVLLPVGAAFADSNGSGRGGNGGGNGVSPTCTGDQAMDRIQARDGTGWRHTLADGTIVEMPNASHGHQTGPMDGSGPLADRPMDGSGNQQRSGG
ncbi:MAG TPA: hypothetical protein VHN36_08920 [Ilumatobacteraceae bacterium]|nr:hypothetical protein [Ilumatobacteraceae bacterium]